jgi:hypothetical protein
MHFTDNARIQFRNCIFMGFRHPLVSAGSYPAAPDTFAAMWTTPYTTRPALNPCANPNQIYQSQTSGNLCQISDCVFFDNGAFPGANYTQSALVGYNLNNNVIATNSPIQSITYGAPVSLQGGLLSVTPITRIDPRPANDALVSAANAPNDGFFSPANYRGAFARQQLADRLDGVRRVRLSTRAISGGTSASSAPTAATTSRSARAPARLAPCADDRLAVALGSERRHVVPCRRQRDQHARSARARWSPTS